MYAIKGSSSDSLAQRYKQLQAEIGAASEAAGRSEGAVHLLAVSKTQPASAIADVAALGQRDFGENYLQEALEKIHALRELSLTWHFIGPIQSNKTRDIAEHFDWVHSVDREKIAQRLSEQRPAHLPPLNICIQVNIDDEDSKSGVAIADVPALATIVHALPGLTFRGLMAIPRADSADHNAAAFRTLAMTLSSLRNTISDLKTQHTSQLDTLSMGMSDDFKVAIAEGATFVRLGTALFGPRN